MFCKYVLYQMHVLQIGLEYHQKDTEKSQKKEKETHMKLENHKM